MRPFTFASKNDCGHSLLLVKVTAVIYVGLAEVNGRIHFRKHRQLQIP